ncbi:MAG: 30S ribosomal protein S3 [Candidatus Levybacteria bacterium RIFCSPLOWO2_02_FULL_36_8b]|nr:MAG: 30S ribosomal protein S3 [Candidatus Levybacteria bacterium RIFCSPLOWO2_02_FULL_36_8b]
MGQKVNPQILRLGILYNWNSRWFDEKRYKDVLIEDYKLRSALMNRLKMAGVARIEIERSINSLKIIAFVSRPGIVIGRAGTGLEDLKKFLISILTKEKKGKNIPKLDIRVEPVKEPNLDAYLVARNISDQLIRRASYKKVLGQTADRVMTSGAKGVRILLSGRINGAEIGRREKIQQGTVPLSTIRESVSFASVPALTKKGYIGVKVWINKLGEK